MSGNVHELLGRVGREGPILSLPGGVVGIFDPELAIAAEAANSRALKIGPFPQDSIFRGGVAPVPWREVRARLIAQTRLLNAPAHLRALHQRMERLIRLQSGRPIDFTQLVTSVMSESLLPLVVAGMSESSHSALARDQQARVRRQLDAARRMRRRGARLSRLLIEIRAGRAASREVRRRLRDRNPPAEDYLAALLPLVPMLGFARVRYLVTSLAIAVSTAPGSVAACILFELLRRPAHREQVAEELARLKREELYDVPLQRLPATSSFIKETMRLWSFPPVTRRAAACEIELGGRRIAPGELFDFSSYVMHHSEKYWTDPERFEPERWLRMERQPPAGCYVPFGFGPRTCVGASLGLSQLVLFCELATRAFEFELDPHRNSRIDLEVLAIPMDFGGTVRTAG